MLLHFIGLQFVLVMPNCYSKCIKLVQNHFMFKRSLDLCFILELANFRRISPRYDVIFISKKGSLVNTDEPGQ